MPVCETWDDVLPPTSGALRAWTPPAQGRGTMFTPGGQGGPGRPMGSRDKMPRGWKDFVAMAYAGKVGWDLDRQRLTYVDPETHEPLLDTKGHVVCPTYFNAAASALMHGLLDGDLKNSTLKEWMKHADKMAVDRSGRGFRIVMYKPPVDPMLRPGETPVYRGVARQLIGHGESPASASQAAQERTAPATATSTRETLPARRGAPAAAPAPILRNRDGDILVEMEDIPDPNEEP